MKREHEKKLLRDKEKNEKLQEAFIDIELCETETVFLLVLYYFILISVIDHQDTYLVKTQQKKKKQLLKLKMINMINLRKRK